jgi:NAD(P)H dehydrogenase (quinone)
MSKTPFRPVMVTGAAGQLGRLVIDNLLARDDLAPGEIIAGTRDPSKLAALAAKGVQIRKIDFDDAASLDEGFKGVGALLVISTGTLDLEGGRARQHLAAIQSAKRAGVGHILYTSLVRPEADSPVPIAGDHHATEQAILATGLPHTFLRHGLYLDNLLFALPSALSSGQWYSAAGSGRTAHVSRADCARADAAALATAGASSRVLDITGGEALTHAEIAAIAARVTGKPLQVVGVPAEGLAAGMTSAGMPGDVARVLASFDSGIAQGYNAAISPALAELTGREPESFASFLAANRAALAG